MPNWVTNHIEFTMFGVHLATIEATIKNIRDLVSHGDGESFDFNAIIPMPKSLDIESGSRGENAYDHYKLYLKAKEHGHDDVAETYRAPFSDEDWALGKQYYDNKQKYGSTTWYDWCCNNWGTKWNASEVSWYNCGVSFDTAWSCVLPVVLKLSKMFPNVIMTYSWYDEDYGNNLGRINDIRNGKYSSEEIEGGYTKEAYELLFDISGCSADEFGLHWDENEGTYVYDE